MAGLSVARVEPATGRVTGAGREQPRRERRPRNGRGGARSRLIAAALPGVPASDCEVRSDIGDDGELLGVVILDATTGAVRARLSLARLVQIGETSDQRGLFFERRG